MELLIKEFRKNLNGKMIFFLIAMFFVCLCISICYVKLDFTIDNLKESVILEYQAKLSGPLNAEKIEYLMDEEEFIIQTFNLYPEMHEKFLKGELERDEYNTFMDDYNSCMTREREFQYIYEKWQLVKEKEEPWIVYDYYWEKLFNQKNVVLFQLIAVIFLACAVMLVEMRNGFYPILNSTPFGRWNVLRCKMIYAVVSSSAFSLMFSFCNLYIYDKVYVLPQKGAPVYNISLFSNVSASLTLLQYFWLNAAVRILLISLLCVLVVLVCYYWKRPSALFMLLCAIIVVSEISYMIFNFQYGLPVSEIFQANWILNI